MASKQFNKQKGYLVGEVIKGGFPSQNPDEFSGEALRDGLIDGKYLVGPTSKVAELINGQKLKLNDLSTVQIYDRNTPDYYPNGEDYDSGLYAPIDWIMAISDEAEAVDPALVRLFQTHALTTVCAKYWLDRLDNAISGKNILNLDSKTHFIIGDETIEFNPRNARDLKLWRAASAVALRAVTTPNDPQRKQLADFLKSCRNGEVDIELKAQGFKPHKSRSQKLRPSKQKYGIDGYKVGCLSPMDAQSLAGVDRVLLRAANS